MSGPVDGNRFRTFSIANEPVARAKTIAAIQNSPDLSELEKQKHTDNANRTVIIRGSIWTVATFLVDTAIQQKEVIIVTDDVGHKNETFSFPPNPTEYLEEILRAQGGKHVVEVWYYTEDKVNMITRLYVHFTD